MMIDADALGQLLLVAAIVGAAGLLLRRLGQIGDTLEAHGRKLVRIETRLNIVDNGGSE